MSIPKELLEPKKTPEEQEAEAKTQRRAWNAMVGRPVDNCTCPLCRAMCEVAEEFKNEHRS